jgi:hypothetical protein
MMTSMTCFVFQTSPLVIEYIESIRSLHFKPSFVRVLVPLQLHFVHGSVHPDNFSTIHLPDRPDLPQPSIYDSIVAIGVNLAEKASFCESDAELVKSPATASFTMAEDLIRDSIIRLIMELVQRSQEGGRSEYQQE